MKQTSVRKNRVLKQVEGVKEVRNNITVKESAN